MQYTCTPHIPWPIPKKIDTPSKTPLTEKAELKAKKAETRACKKLLTALIKPSLLLLRPFWQPQERQHHQACCPPPPLSSSRRAPSFCCSANESANSLPLHSIHVSIQIANQEFKRKSAPIARMGHLRKLTHHLTPCRRPYRPLSRRPSLLPS